MSILTIIQPKAVQDFEQTIRTFAPKVKSEEDVNYLMRAVEVLDSLKGVKLTSSLAKTVELTTADLRDRFRHLIK